MPNINIPVASLKYVEGSRTCAYNMIASYKYRHRNFILSLVNVYHKGEKKEEKE